MPGNGVRWAKPRAGRAPSVWVGIGATWLPALSAPLCAVRSSGVVSTSCCTPIRTPGRQASIDRQTAAVASAPAAAHGRSYSVRAVNELAHIDARPDGAADASATLGNVTNIAGAVGR